MHFLLFLLVVSLLLESVLQLVACVVAEGFRIAFIVGRWFFFFFLLSHAVAHNHVDCGRWWWWCVCDENWAWHHIFIGSILDISKYLERKLHTTANARIAVTANSGVWVSVHSAMHRTRMRWARVYSMHFCRDYYYSTYTRSGASSAVCNCLILFFFRVQCNRTRKRVYENVLDAKNQKFTLIRCTAFQHFTAIFDVSSVPKSNGQHHLYLPNLDAFNSTMHSRSIDWSLFGQSGVFSI